MIKRYIKIFIIVIYALITLDNFSFANEDNEKVEYEIQSSLKTTDFAEWIEYDEKYLEALSKKGNWSDLKIYKEIGILNKELTDLRDNYYIKNKANARLYPAQITGCIHALTTGINNRYYLLNNSSLFKYEEGELNIRSKMDYTDEKGGVYDRKLYDYFLNLALDVLNSNNIPNGLLKESYIYISPYKLDASFNLVDNGMRGNSSYTSIVLSPMDIALSTDIPLTDKEKKMIFLYAFYHEMGHSFLNSNVRSGIDVNSFFVDDSIDVEIVNDYKETTMKPFNEEYLSSFNERFANDYAFYFISKYTDLNNNENAILSYLLNFFRVEDYAPEKFEPFIEKYISKFNSQNTLPLVYIGTKTASNIDNLHYFDFSTEDNLLTVNVNNNYKFGDSKVYVRIIPTNSLFSKTLSFYLGKLDQNNRSKSVMLPNGEYTLTFTYVDVNFKEYKLSPIYVDIK